MNKSYVVVSSRGGAGKTAFTANLATALCRRGKRVLAIDADTGMRSLDIALGLESAAVYDSIDVIEETCTLQQALLSDPKRPGLWLLPAAQWRERAELTPEGLRNIALQAADQFDYIIIDAPTGVERGFDAACAAADSAIIITTPEPDSVRGAQQLTGLLERRDIFEYRLAINRADTALIQAGIQPPVEELLYRLNIPALAILPNDAEVAAQRYTGAELDPRGASGIAYDDAARRLIGEDVPLSTPRVRPEFNVRLKNSLRVLRGAQPWNEAEE